ncbi:MAG TPA: cytochrome ubiquinol oxidase subunit I [Gammaproteobacteria bacterium]|nr:cytochrome ubiquinol oxidase subunit I [Gammaproteobacteria bacterium]
MTETLDMLFLARAQFAFTVAFHIIFPAFTIGLASYLAMLEGLWLKTGRDVYLILYRYWVKIFAISFGMGVVSGVVMSYQFGTNWSEFSSMTGNVLGPLLGYEVMTAFFLEASFLAIMLFGWNKVGRKLHFFSTCAVAVGTLISAFWILAANSWMHTPAGYEIRDGVFYASNWLEVIFNPSFPYRFCHMVLAAYLTTAFVVVSVAAFQILRGMQREASGVMLKMGILFISIVAPLQIFVGHEHGINVHEHQPIKLAAMEGHWETHTGAPMVVFAVPDEKAEMNHFELAIPQLGSLIVTHSLDGEIKGLKEWPASERPPVAVVFWCFRIMVAIGMLMLLVAAWGLWLFRQGKLAETKNFLRLCVLMGPAGFVAVITGWFTAEVGRQPYTVYGLLRTVDSASPITANSVGMSLIVFVFTYAIVFFAGIYYIFRLIHAGPGETAGSMKDMESKAVLSDRASLADFERELFLSFKRGSE